MKTFILASWLAITSMVYSGEVVLEWDPSPDQVDKYLVRYAPAGTTTQTEFEVYEAECTLNLTPGEWNVTIVGVLDSLKGEAKETPVRVIPLSILASSDLKTWTKVSELVVASLGRSQFWKLEIPDNSAAPQPGSPNLMAPYRNNNGPIPTQYDVIKAEQIQKPKP